MDENLELDVIASTSEGSTKRLHLEYNVDNSEISVEIFELDGSSSSEKINIAEKTIINFAKSIDKIRRAK